MLKLLNFKWDKRTAMNIAKFPLIIVLRIPIALFLIAVCWLNDWSEVIMDKLPAWDTYPRNKKPF